MSNNLLEVTELKKHFRINKRTVIRAVDGVSFAIKRGSTLGLVGESGCGKTTVGRLLLRLYSPDSGNIYFDNSNISHITRSQSKSITKKVQMVFQDPYSSLNPFLTVRQIINDGIRLHRLFSSVKEESERVTELLELVGLSMLQADCFPYELSGGQRQRVGIARALALNPQFIVCDEVISALDVSMQAQIINLLLSLQESLGLTYLFISHDLNVVQHISDTIAVMYLGTIVEYGNALEVFNRPLHPYTKSLVSSIPIADPIIERNRNTSIIGDVPNAEVSFAGCRFSKRCRFATPACYANSPTLRDVGGGHLVFCHHNDAL